VPGKRYRSSKHVGTKPTMISYLRGGNRGPAMPAARGTYPLDAGGPEPGVFSHQKGKAMKVKGHRQSVFDGCSPGLAAVLVIGGHARDAAAANVLQRRAGQHVRHRAQLSSCRATPRATRCACSSPWVPAPSPERRRAPGPQLTLPSPALRPRLLDGSAAVWRPGRRRVLRG